MPHVSLQTYVTLFLYWYYLHLVALIWNCHAVPSLLCVHIQLLSFDWEKYPWLSKCISQVPYVYGVSYIVCLFLWLYLDKTINMCYNRQPSVSHDPICFVYIVCFLFQMNNSSFTSRFSFFFTERTGRLFPPLLPPTNRWMTMGWSKENQGNIGYNFSTLLYRQELKIAPLLQKVTIFVFLSQNQYIMKLAAVWD